jgi:peptidoglycan-associated lipoprotein
MIPILPGRGGWRIRAYRLTRASALVIALALAAASPIALGGCGAKKPATPGAGAGGAPGLGEQGIGSKSSLEQFQKGQLGAEGGPLTDIHFDYNDFTVRPQDSEILRANATWLSQHPNAKVQVEGHCDERGSEEYNIALGAKRAQAAKDFLVTLGVAASRLSTISYGKELPLCNEHEDSCWARNRRAHFVVTE